MKNFGLITSAFLAYAGLSTQAFAATFTPSLTGPIDFGDVALGESRTVDFSILVEFDPSETPDGGSRVINRSGDLGVAFINGDCLFGGRCDYQFSFTPQDPGLQSRMVDLVTINTFGAPSQIFEVELIGTGTTLSQVPLPASMPFLLIGAAGFAAVRFKSNATKRG